MPARNKQTAVGIVLLICLVALVGVINKMTASIVEPAPIQSGKTVDVTKPPSADTLAANWDGVLSVTPAPPRGRSDAPFSLVEFGDFQCPQCGQVRPHLERAIQGANGRVNLYFVQRPFPSIHAFAIPASEAALYAAKHGKFWTMYDLLYTHQDDLAPVNYPGYASRLGMNAGDMRRSVDGETDRSSVDQSSAFADRLGVWQTPTVGLRDNRSGKFIWVVNTRPDIISALGRHDWALPTTRTASAGIPGGRS